jgi:hypothetical protein
LKLRAEAGQLARDRRQVPDVAAGVPELHLVAADERQVLPEVREARHVDVPAADATILLDRVPFRPGRKPLTWTRICSHR